MRPEVIKYPETQQQFLDAVLWWFSENPRSLSPKDTRPRTCLYGGNGCAIGIWMSKEDSEKLDEISNDIAVTDDRVLEVLPKVITDLSPKFLRLVQIIHDLPKYCDGDYINMNKVYSAQLFREFTELRIYSKPLTGNPYLKRPKNNGN